MAWQRNVQAGSDPNSGNSTAQTIAQIIAASTQPQQAVSSPIGVPYYQIDPATGQPAKDASGQPVRWQAHPGTGGPAFPVPGIQQVAGATGATLNAPAQYFDGDQWAPGSLPPEELVSLQKAMVQVGLAKPGQLQLGVWDQSSMGAYSQLLAFANSSGLDWQTALQQWGSAHQANPAEIRTPLTVKVSDPAELEQVFRGVVIDKLGQGWDQSKLQAMVQAYQGVETAAQQQQYAMTGSGSPTDPGTGGTIVAPPSAQAFAESQVRAQDPVGVQEHDALGMINQFHQLIGGWK